MFGWWADIVVYNTLSLVLYSIHSQKGKQIHSINLTTHSNKLRYVWCVPDTQRIIRKPNLSIGGRGCTGDRRSVKRLFQLQNWNFQYLIAEYWEFHWPKIKIEVILVDKKPISVSLGKFHYIVFSTIRSQKALKTTGQPLNFQLDTIFQSTWIVPLLFGVHYEMENGMDQANC